jgi:hypothetical protein
MFQVTRKGPSRIDIEFSGSLDSDEMKVALEDLINTAKDIEHGRVLYRIRDMGFPTLGAVGVELSRLPELFRLMKNFDRAAVLADKEWIKIGSEIEGALIPGITIKAFDPDEEEEAEAWLAHE